jgi:hypothetical protein
MTLGGTLEIGTIFPSATVSAPGALGICKRQAAIGDPIGAAIARSPNRFFRRDARFSAILSPGQSFSLGLRPNFPNFGTRPSLSLDKFSGIATSDVK